MNAHFLKNFARASLLLLAAACAKTGSLVGGPKDEQPPQVLAAQSTPNFATNFTQKRIELRFDEWVQLADVGTQVVVSPPLASRPTVTLHGKVVRFQFAENEQLRPNTTYTINFGNAVKDFTEGNAAKDLRFVFSTGEKLDSLRLSGSVADAFSGEPSENLTVTLYDQLADSVPRKERPFYLAKTAKSGQFEFQNLRPGQFKLLAFDDGNQNNKWDDGEKIAFAPLPISVADSTRAPHNLLISKELPPLRSVETNAPRYGFAKFGFNQTPPNDLRPLASLPAARLVTERTADTLLIWYDFPENALPAAPWQLAAGRDTLRVKLFDRAEFLKTKIFALADDAAIARLPRRKTAQPNSPEQPSLPIAIGTQAAIRTILQNPGKPLALDFNLPVAAADTAKWQLVDDSTKTATRAFRVDTVAGQPRRLQLVTAWKSAHTYFLEMLPGAATDFFGGTNADTLRRKIIVLSERQLGSLTLTLKNLTLGERYVLRLENGQLAEVENVFTATAAEQVFAFPNLPTANYAVRLIFDADGNGRWSPSSYFLHRAPERVLVKKLEPLQAGFELKTVVDLLAPVAPAPTGSKKLGKF